MLSIFAEARGVLLARADRLVARLRDVQNRRREHAVLLRLLGEDDYRLHDIGLTRDDVAEMLRRNADSRRASDTGRPAPWSHGAPVPH